VPRAFGEREVIHSGEAASAGNVIKRERRGSDLFGGLSAEEIAALGASSAEESVPKGGILFPEGQSLGHLYIVTQGSFKLVRYSDEGREFIVDLAGSGDAFGALIEPEIATVVARALETSVCLSVPVAGVRRAIERNPELAVRAVQSAVCRARAAEVRAARLAFERVPQRLASLLLEVTDRRSGHLRFPLNQSELASFIGSSRETVCSILNQLRRDSIVASPRGRLHVLDRRRLEEFAPQAVASS
jgi:CRP-like cAMP-binding protein